jgi:dienelactone hydrolase
MARFFAALAALAVAVWAGAAAAQERVQFPSAGDNGAVDGYLMRPAGAGRHPALVFLHGCGGLISPSTHAIMSRDFEWAGEFQRRGYAVLLVDSFTMRGHGQMCSPQTLDLGILRKRPYDAYGALSYLQAQDFVDPGRIGVIGWSEGGGVVLSLVDPGDPARPAALPQGDFRAAAAFYPAACRENARPIAWTSAMPLLWLQGADDVWTPAGPCRELMEAGIRRGGRIEMQIYPGAYHDFDWIGLPRRELPQYRTTAGIVPITGMDPAARADALVRAPEFFARTLGGP